MNSVSLSGFTFSPSMVIKITGWAPDPPDLPIKQGQRETLNSADKSSDIKRATCSGHVVEPMHECVWRAKYDEVNAENEQLRLMLRLRLGEPTGGSQSDLRLVHQKPNSSLPQCSTAVDANSTLLPQCQPVVNVDQRGGNITEIGRDVHNHVHNHWVAISVSGGNTIAILVIFLD